MDDLKLIKIYDMRIGRRCQLCKEIIKYPEQPELHHIIRRGLAQTQELSEIVNTLSLTAILCSYCNHTDADCIDPRNTLLRINKKLYGKAFVETLKKLYQIAPALTLLQVPIYKELINENPTNK